MSNRSMHAHTKLQHAFPTRLSWTLRIDEIPQEGHWFWAVNPIAAARFKGEQVGLYAGFQQCGVERLAIFSVWGAERTDCWAPFRAHLLDESGPVSRILGPFSWRLNTTYRFVLDVTSRRLILVILSEDGTSTDVGTQHLPRGWFEGGFHRRLDCFAEWFGPSEPVGPMKARIDEVEPTYGEFRPGKTELGRPADASGGSVIFLQRP